MLIKAAAAVVALGILHRAGLGIYRTARRIEDTFDLVHHELKPNSGGSLRDAIDRIETEARDAAGLAGEAANRADTAAKTAQSAATTAQHAADHSAAALDRIERLEQTRPPATAATSIVVHPPAAAEQNG